MIVHSCGSRISQRGTLTYYLAYFLAKTAWKWKRWTEKEAIPLDPPLVQKNSSVSSPAHSPVKKKDDHQWYQISWSSTESYVYQQIRMSSSFSFQPQSWDLRHLLWGNKVSYYFSNMQKFPILSVGKMSRCLKETLESIHTWSSEVNCPFGKKNLSIM